MSREDHIRAALARRDGEKVAILATFTKAELRAIRTMMEFISAGKCESMVCSPGVWMALSDKLKEGIEWSQMSG